MILICMFKLIGYIPLTYTFSTVPGVSLKVCFTDLYYNVARWLFKVIFDYFVLSLKFEAGNTKNRLELKIDPP